MVYPFARATTSQIYIFRHMCEWRYAEKAVRSTDSADEEEQLFKLL